MAGLWGLVLSGAGMVEPAAHGSTVRGRHLEEVVKLVLLMATEVSNFGRPASGRRETRHPTLFDLTGAREHVQCG